MSNWQAIETAPKDGTEIIGWGRHTGPILIRWTAPAYFMTEDELDAVVTGEDNWQNQEDWFCADFVEGSRLDGSMIPTHWQPLPAPPQTEEVG